MSGAKRLDNVAPVVYETKSRERPTNSKLDDDGEDLLDAREVFDYIRDINDPEHPYTLEQLNVVEEDLIQVYFDKREFKELWLEFRSIFLTKTCLLLTLLLLPQFLIVHLLH